MSEESKEYRQSPRVAHPFMVRYRVAADWQAPWHVSALRDFSSHGARFLSEQSFDAGALLELQLVLPTARQPVLVQARMAWMKPGQWGMHEIGVTFDPGDAGVQEMIDAAVAHFVRKQEGKA